MPTSRPRCARRRRHEPPRLLGQSHWDPYLSDEIERMAEYGVTRALAVFTSAHSSYSANATTANIIAARDEVAERRPDLTIPHIDRSGLLRPPRLHRAVRRSDPHRHRRTRGGRTTDAGVHRPLDSDVDGVDLRLRGATRQAARLVAERVADPPRRTVWQSRSGPPQIPWLEPDVNDEIRRLADTGVESVVIVPVGSSATTSR